MPFMLYYRGQGKVFMAGVTEYITLLDQDELTDDDKQGHCAPGFELNQVIEIDDDISSLPCEEALVKHH